MRTAGRILAKSLPLRPIAVLLPSPTRGREVINAVCIVLEAVGAGKHGRISVIAGDSSGIPHPLFDLVIMNIHIANLVGSESTGASILLDQRNAVTILLECVTVNFNATPDRSAG